MSEEIKKTDEIENTMDSELLCLEEFRKFMNDVTRDEEGKERIWNMNIMMGWNPIEFSTERLRKKK